MNIRNINLCLIGDYGVGKSHLRDMYIFHKSSVYMTHMQRTMITIQKTEHRSICVTVYDTMNEEITHDLNKSYYEKAHGVLCVFDVTDIKSFNNVKQWIYRCNHFIKNVPKLLVGNKLDLQRKVSLDDAKKLAEELNMEYVETTITQYVTVEHAFVKLINVAINSIEQRYNKSLRDILMQSHKLIDIDVLNLNLPDHIKREIIENKKQLLKYCLAMPSRK